MNFATIYFSGALFAFLFMFLTDLKYNLKIIRTNIFRKPNNYQTSYVELLTFPFAWLITVPLTIVTLIVKD